MSNNDDDQLTALMRLSGHPLRLLREGGKLGLGSVSRLVAILALFVSVNLILFGYAAYKLLWVAYSHSNAGILFFLIVLGTAFTAYAGYRAYFGVVLDIAKFVYGNSSPLFHSICGQIVDHASEFYSKHSSGVQSGMAKIDPDGKNIAKIIDLQKIMTEKYGKAPRLVRGGVSFVLNRLPIVGMLLELKDVLVADDGKTKATDLLHHKIDRYVEESIFSQNTIRWVFWLLPLNVLAVLLPLIK